MARYGKLALNKSGEEPLRDSSDNDALLEARELTLALGSTLGDEELAKRGESSEIISPSLPEPLTKRPLVGSRIGGGESQERLTRSNSLSLKANTLSSSLESTKHSPSSEGESGEASNERSGLMKLQKVLSEVPRKVDES